MLGGFTSGAERIYLHCGATDFRNQITGLVALVTLQFQLDPYTPTHVFLFCNKRRTSIKVLRYDKKWIHTGDQKAAEWNEVQLAKRCRRSKKYFTSAG